MQVPNTASQAMCQKGNPESKVQEIELPFNGIVLVINLENYWRLADILTLSIIRPLLADEVSTPVPCQETSPYQY